MVVVSLRGNLVKVFAVVGMFALSLLIFKFQTCQECLLGSLFDPIPKFLTENYDCPESEITRSPLPQLFDYRLSDPDYNLDQLKLLGSSLNSLEGYDVLDEDMWNLLEDVVLVDERDFVPLIHSYVSYSQKVHGGGIDIGKKGIPIVNLYAPLDMRVIRKESSFDPVIESKKSFDEKSEEGYGNYIFACYTHNGKPMVMTFAHLDMVSVQPGQFIEAGTFMGTVGNTGRSYGGHLHWSIHNGELVHMKPYAAAVDAAYLGYFPTDYREGFTKMVNPLFAMLRPDIAYQVLENEDMARSIWDYGVDDFVEKNIIDQFFTRVAGASSEVIHYSAFGNMELELDQIEVEIGDLLTGRVRSFDQEGVLYADEERVPRFSFDSGFLESVFVGPFKRGVLEFQFKALAVGLPLLSLEIEDVRLSESFRIIPQVSEILVNGPSKVKVDDSVFYTLYALDEKKRFFDNIYKVHVSTDPFLDDLDNSVMFLNSKGRYEFSSKYPGVYEITFQHGDVLKAISVVVR